MKINKENVDVALNAIVWYGIGYHGRETTIDLSLLIDIFEIEESEDLNKLYDLLVENSLVETIDSGLFCTDESISVRYISHAPIDKVKKNIPLAIRSVLYSLKEDIDDQCIYMTELMNDIGL